MKPFVNGDSRSEIRGFIQAGGLSSRMKTDKAWVEIEGVTMIERALAAAGPAVCGMGIIVNAANPQLERYENLAKSSGASLIFDLHEHLGPLGGIHTALLHCQDVQSAMILACDMPFITTEFLSFIRDIHHSINAGSSVNYPVSVTVPLDQSNRQQPLAAIYNNSLATIVGRMLAANDLKVDHLYSQVSTRYVPFEEFSFLRGAEKFFVNVNTPEEYLAILN